VRGFRSGFLRDESYHHLSQCETLEVQLRGSCISAAPFASPFPIFTFAHPFRHLYTYIPTYIHTYIPTYLHTDIPTYRHTDIPKYLHTYIPTYLIPTYLIPTYLIPTYLPTYLHTYIHTYLHTYIHTYVHTYIHTYIHIHTYTHTHTHINTYVGYEAESAGDGLRADARQRDPRNTSYHREQSAEQAGHGVLLPQVCMCVWFCVCVYVCVYVRVSVCV
jgi:hypothetical protein